MPNMKNTKKHNSNTFPNMGSVSRSNMTRILIPMKGRKGNILVELTPSWSNGSSVGISQTPRSRTLCTLTYSVTCESLIPLITARPTWDHSLHLPLLMYVTFFPHTPQSHLDIFPFLIVSFYTNFLVKTGGLDRVYLLFPLPDQIR